MARPWPRPLLPWAYHRSQVPGVAEMSHMKFAGLELEWLAQV